MVRLSPLIGTVEQRPVDRKHFPVMVTSLPSLSGVAVAAVARRPVITPAARKRRRVRMALLSECEISSHPTPAPRFHRTNTDLVSARHVFDASKGQQNGNPLATSRRAVKNTEGIRPVRRLIVASEPPVARGIASHPHGDRKLLFLRKLARRTGRFPQLVDSRSGVIRQYFATISPSCLAAKTAIDPAARR